MGTLVLLKPLFVASASAGA
eukprot:IDg5438t1